jgi:hypothetical protein
MAAVLRTQQPNISAFERGDRALTLPALLRAAAALKTTPNVLLGLEPIAYPPLEDRRLLRRFQAAQGLSRRQKLALLKYLDEFLKRAK